MKKILITVLGLSVSQPLFSQDRISIWDFNDYNAGLNFGLAHTTSSFKMKHRNLQNNLRYPYNHIYGQVFLNHSFGRTRKWMWELGMAYYTRSSENLYLDLSGNYEYSWIKYNNYNPQLTIRYQFYKSKKLDWHHYIGYHLSFSFDNWKRHYFSNHAVPTGQVMYGIFYGKRLYTYRGLEYYNKIRLTDRISIQSSICFDIQAEKLEFTSPLIAFAENDQVNYRIIYSFGMAWKL